MWGDAILMLITPPPSVTPVSSAITEVTSLASEVAASISALRGTVPAPEPTNETSAQTDTTPVNAIYIDGQFTRGGVWDVVYNNFIFNEITSGKLFIN